MFVVDAHQHIWNLERADYPWLSDNLGPINRTFEFDEAASALHRNGIERTVLVQASDNDADTDYMVEVADTYAEVAGIVAWVPLDRPADAERRLAALRENPVVVGVRALIHEQPDPDWLRRPDVDAGLGVLEAADVPFDLVSVLPRHLEHVPAIVERHPRLRIVIDHLSKPPIGLGDDEPWASLIARAAESPAVSAKLSGLYPATADSRELVPDQIEPYVHRALELFGADRLMYGGDWPISVPYGGYEAVWACMSEVFGRLSDHERTAILSGTACEFYRLPGDRLPEGER